MKIKTVWPVVLLLVVPAAAVQKRERWRVVAPGSSDEWHLYFDASRVIRSGDLARVWVKFVYTEKMKRGVQSIFLEIDCGDEPRMRELSIINFSLSGEVLREEREPRK